MGQQIASVSRVAAVEKSFQPHSRPASRRNHAPGGGSTIEPRAVPPIVRDVLRSPGQPLDQATRDFMEPRFGHDFGRVRVHTDQRAAESARAVRARAYTVGNDVAFGANMFAPTSQPGRRLLAHELAHTIQQRQPAGLPPSPEAHGILESSADLAARDVSEGRRISTELPASRVGLARTPDEDADRAAAVAEALAYVARTKEEETLEIEKDRKEKEENVAAVSMTLGGTRPVRKRPPRQTAPAPGEGDYERYTAPIFAEMAENQKQLEAEYAQEAQIVKRPFEKRLRQARAELVRQSSDWHDRKKAERLMTAGDVWLYGLNNGLFVEREKKFVYAEQDALHEYLREQQQKRYEQAKADREIKQYNDHVARGEQLSAPGPIVTSFALPALGAVGLAIGGAQTGMMVGDAVNKCRSGTAGDCAAAVAPAVAAAVAHKTVFKTPVFGGRGLGNKPPNPPPGNTTIKGNPPPPPARPPAQTINASPPPPPVPVRRGPLPVADTEVVAANARNPSSIKPQDPAVHQQRWQQLGGLPGHKAPLAYRDPAGNILVSKESWLLAPAQNVRVPAVAPGAPVKSPPRVPPARQPTPPPAKRNLGTEDTGQAPPVAGPDPLANTPPAAPPPPVRQLPAPNRPPGGNTGVEVPEPPVVGPQPISPQGVERMRRLPAQVPGARKGRGNSVNYSVDAARHQEAWQRLGGYNEAPPAFIYEGQVYLDPSRWPPKIP